MLHSPSLSTLDKSDVLLYFVGIKSTLMYCRKLSLYGRTELLHRSQERCGFKTGNKILWIHLVVLINNRHSSTDTWNNTFHYVVNVIWIKRTSGSSVIIKVNSEICIIDFNIRFGRFQEIAYLWYNSLNCIWFILLNLLHITMQARLYHNLILTHFISYFILFYSFFVYFFWR